LTNIYEVIYRRSPARSPLAATLKHGCDVILGVNTMHVPILAFADPIIFAAVFLPLAAIVCCLRLTRVRSSHVSVWSIVQECGRTPEQSSGPCPMICHQPPGMLSAGFANQEEA